MSMISKKQFCDWLCLRQNKLYSWHQRYGQANKHNGSQPHSHWLLDSERQAILEYYSKNQEVGYRRLCYMMLDADIVAVSPSSVYRVLSSHGYLRRWPNPSTRKGTGFESPLVSHEHWHLDISYLNLGGTFYYLISIIDGYSRYLVHWDIRESMKELDVALVVQRAKELYPEANPRVITDNGKQFIARDLKELFRFHGMTHVRTSPYYPQSNGKIERWYGTLKRECVRPCCPSTVVEAKRVVANYVNEYNNRRLHSAIGYVTPRDKLLGYDREIWNSRKKKLLDAKEYRLQMHQYKQINKNDEMCLMKNWEKSFSV